MTLPLWTFETLKRAITNAVSDGETNATIAGFSIDTRSLQPGDAFVALKDQRDGHDFVGAAFKAGASVAIVSESYIRQPGDGALLRSADPLIALQNAGIARRADVEGTAKVVAVTGSAGKTGTKEMLRACMMRLGRTHASEKSYNNHWGVPLTLARMPANTQYAAFEIGMNHAGEITPLTGMVRPHVAIITTVEAVHLEHFGSVEAIADAKAEIFSGLLPGGAAIIKRDNPHFERLRASAAARGARVVSFGLPGGADVVAEDVRYEDDGTSIEARVHGKRIAYRLAMPGRHIAENSLAVVAALDAIGADLGTALAALRDLAPPGGRGLRIKLMTPAGAILLIDESYNANPASMRAALETVATVPRTVQSRRIAVLGDMLELGPQSGELHAGLIDAVDKAGIDLVFAAGPKMKLLFERVPLHRRGAWSENSKGIEAALLEAVRGGDAVMIKGSNSSRMAPLVEALKLKYSPMT
jgi:UDP-N-acetylmuramoyl-tripeptide--D-alanyl-D-alanine ligase